MIADAFHELKTPLSVIVSQSKTTLRWPTAAEDYKRALEVIPSTGRMMSEMVGKLVGIALDLVQLHNGSMYLASAEEKGTTITPCFHEV